MSTYKCNLIRLTIKVSAIKAYQGFFLISQRKGGVVMIDGLVELIFERPETYLKLCGKRDTAVNSHINTRSMRLKSKWLGKTKLKVSRRRGDVQKRSKVPRVTLTWESWKIKTEKKNSQPPISRRFVIILCWLENGRMPGRHIAV